MLNQTNLIRYIELELGYNFTDLEIGHDEIMDIIKLRTLPTFSKFYPHLERIVVNSETDRVEGYNNRYFLKTSSEIMNVNDVINMNNRSFIDNTIVGATPNPLMGQGVGNFIERQTIADLGSASFNPITFMYYHPNMIEIAPGMGGNFLVVVNTVHHSNLLTIPNNMQEIFLELASIDVRASLYLIRRRFQTLDSPYGQLEMFIDTLESAKGEREELITKMKESMNKTAYRRKIWIA